MPSLIRHCILLACLFSTFAWADTPNTTPTFTLSDFKDILFPAE